MNGRSRRTLLLAVVALLLLGANIWWLTQRNRDAEPDFVLGSSSAEITLQGRELDRLPRFDGKRGWTEQGNPLRSLRPYLRQQGGSASKAGEGASPYVAVSLPDDADADTMRAMLLSLVGQNLCHVALVQQDGRGSATAPVKAFIQRVVFVRDENGDRRSCRAV